MTLSSIIPISIFAVFTLLILISMARNPIPRKIGLRNIRRRISNTVLVVIGSMVGAALISGSLVLSDSLDKTFLKLVDDQVGEIDLYLMFDKEKLSDAPFAYIQEDEYQKIKNTLPNDKIDGVQGVHFTQVAPQKVDDNGNPVINTYMIDLWGVNFDEFNSFGEEPRKLNKLENENGIYISELVAKRLEASAGDIIRIPFGNALIEFKIEDVLERGAAPGDPSMVANIGYLNKELGIPEDAVSAVFISANGGIEPDDYEGKEFEKSINEGLEDFKSENVSITTYEVKEDALNGYGMKMFSTFFLVMSFFGIFAGILLIVNLYSMLASERKYEMGILRAIALTKTQLTRTFIYEGFVYTVISSLLGTAIGVVIGYGLIWALDKMFTDILDLVGMSDIFKMQFDAQLDSLLIAFSIGSIITIITAAVSSSMISRLNIVSAIRNVTEVKEFKVTVMWIVKTLILAGLTFMSLMTFLFFFTARDTFTEMRKQEGSAMAELSPAKFEENVNVAQSYSLYVGFVFTVIFGTFLLNRLVKLFTKKDIARYTITLACLATIIFTALLSKFEAFKKAGESDSSIVLFFISGIVLVVSMAFVVTYNMGLFIKVISFLLRPFRGLTPVVKISLRYPAENKSRTGLTLVMFAIVIYLIVYTSMMKATIRQVNDQTLEDTLGGYQVLVVPSYEVNNEQVGKIIDDIDEIGGTEDVVQIMHTSVVMPEYKYKDLDEAPVYDNPALYQFEDEDFFRTLLDGLPADFIRENEIELEQRAEGYDSDEAVWEDVINDPSKVVIGDAFTVEGYGRKPDLLIGQKVQIADAFNTASREVEIVGIVKSQDSMGMTVNYYPNVITTNSAITENFPDLYVNQFSSSQVLIKYGDDIDISENTKEVKKALINYNILQVYELQELTQTGQSFMDSMILMFQAFLGFSLIVGASGLAIIVTRSVQERKQQIGMLRSLGFQRSMILTSFFIEATFITLLGIVIGISMGTLGALNEFYVAFGDEPDIKPNFAFTEVFIIAALVYIASLIFALSPSIKAAKLSPVEATNYPE